MEQLIDFHGPLVWGIILRRVSDRSAAEDLAQEIFTEIWQKAGRYDPGLCSEAGYIAMIARRRSIDWIRRREKLPEISPLPETPDLAGETASPGSGIDREMVWAALSGLAEETRRLFILHFEKGLSHAEIAAETGLPLGSVKTRLRRGLIEARALLKSRTGVMNPVEGGAS